MTQPLRQVGFCVMYRWKLRPGLEAQSIAAWKRATQLIMQHRGGLGSRLHKADDGSWYAYAQWPSKEIWEAHRAAPPIDPEIARLVLAAEEMEFPPVCLTPVANFLLCSNCQDQLSIPEEMRLYETHIPVANTENSKTFYLDIVGLQFAHRDRNRDIIFLWAGTGKRSMLGLWGPSTSYGSDPHKCHLAFAVSLPELMAIGRQLNAADIQTRNFASEETTEPSVIGWMPSAQLYFRDPDGHSVEFIALLDDTPDPGFIGSLTQWRQKRPNEAVE